MVAKIDNRCRRTSIYGEMGTGYEFQVVKRCTLDASHYLDSPCRYDEGVRTERNTDEPTQED